MGRFTVRDAQRKQAKLHAVLSGPSGCGKTFGGLLIGEGLGGNIVVIDTERRSADKYQGRQGMPPFRVIEFDPPYTPEAYIEAIDTAEADGADVIIIDSISHEWDGPGGCLELVDEIARAKFRGNTWSAWSELTPRHRKFIDRMLSSKCHIIATARSKTETAQIDDNGRKKVVKLGMKSIARDGTEFEFDVCLDIVHDGHFAVASKDRTGVFSGDPKPITEETGKRLAEWLAGGKPVATPQVSELAVKAGVAIDKATTIAQVEKCRKALDTYLSKGELTSDEWSALTDRVDNRLEAVRGELTEAN